MFLFLKNVFAVVLVLACCVIGNAQEEQSKSDLAIEAECAALHTQLMSTVERLEELGQPPQQDWKALKRQVDLSKKIFAANYQMRRQRSDAISRWIIEGGVVRGQDDLSSRQKAIGNFFKFVDEAAKPSPYWIGVQCEPVETYELKVTDSLVAPVQGGLKIITVTTDSPAEKCGIQEGDVLISFGENPVNELGDLLIAIGESEENPTELAIVRDQAVQKIEITPALRKTETGEADKSDDPEDFSLVDTLTGAKQKLPEGYSVTIEMKKDEEVSMVFEKDGKTWKCSEGAVDELPEDLREFASNAMGVTSEWVNYDRAIHFWMTSDLPSQAIGPLWRMERNHSSNHFMSIYTELKELKALIEELKSDK